MKKLDSERPETKSADIVAESIEGLKGPVGSTVETRLDVQQSIVCLYGTLHEIAPAELSGGRSSLGGP
jgi:hypothetical protein